MRKLMWFTVGFAVACALGCYWDIARWFVFVGAVGAVLGIGLSFVPKKPVKILGVVLFGLGVAMLWQQGYHTLYLQDAKLLDGETVRAEVLVTDYGVQTDYGTRVEGTVKVTAKSYRVRVYLDETEELKPGDRLEGEFRFRLTTKDALEGSTFHQGSGTFLLVYQESDITIDKTDSESIQYFAPRLRKGILEMIESLFPEDTAAFAKALLLGQTEDLDYETDTAFQVSGVRHIVAVSGLHISILFSLVYVFGGKRRFFTAVVGIPVLMVFAALAGFTPSIVRACTMQVLVIMAMLLKKEYDPPTALAFSVLIMLCVNPMAITSVSLQFSAGCMVGIFLFGSRIYQYLRKLLGEPKGKTLRSTLTNWFCGSVSVSLSAMSVTTPLCAYYFGMVSIVGVVTNLLTLWVVSLIFYGIMISCIFGAFWQPVGGGIAWMISWLIRYVQEVARLLSAIPFAAIYTCSIFTLLWLGFAYLSVTVFLLQKKKQPGLLAVCLTGTLILSVALSYLTPKLNDLEITVLDVGQGQSILLRSENTCYLVDCGGDSDEVVADCVAEQLLSQGIRHLDGIILTHYDKDHAAGLPFLLTRIQADRLYLPDIADDGKIKAFLIETYPDHITWIEDAVLLQEQWGTIHMIPGEKGAAENESGLSILFQKGNYDILITGDKNTVAERYMIQNYPLPQVELLVVGHHGANSSTGFELLSTVQPANAVISVGRDNRYGHPAPNVLERLAEIGCRVWRTDLDGTIIFRR